MESMDSAYGSPPRGCWLESGTKVWIWWLADEDGTSSPARLCNSECILHARSEASDHSLESREAQELTNFPGMIEDNST